MLQRIARLGAAIVASMCLAATAAAQGLIRDAEIEAILREYTDPILVEAGLQPEDVALYIINDSSLNAFVAGGQRIHLHTGLIIEAETPGQLKGVIAHETCHIACGHGVTRLDAAAVAQRPALLSIGLGIIAIAAGAPEVGVGILGQGQQLAAATFFGHTRAEEATADQKAVDYLEALGESPAGLLEFFENFRYVETLSDARFIPPYFRSHPLARDRIQALRRRAEETGLLDEPPSERAVHQLAVMHAKLIGYLEPPVKVRQVYPPSDESDYALLARSISAFRAVDINAALVGVDELLARDPDNPYYYELKGQILFEGGRVADSVEPNARAVELSGGHPLIQVSYARSLLARNEPGDVEAAESALRDALIAEPDNAFAFQQLAIALDKQNRRHEAELATAERSFHVGDYVGAQVFAQRALAGLEAGTPMWRRASDIAAVTDPRRSENRRFRRP